MQIFQCRMFSGKCWILWCSYPCLWTATKIIIILKYSQLCLSHASYVNVPEIFIFVILIVNQVLIHLQVFYGVLLQYFAVLANQKPLNFRQMNLLVKPLMEMSVDTPYFAAICARQRILRTRTQFCEDIKNSGHSI